MSKFKIKLKLQGLELEVEGSREDVPLITQNLGAQLAGMMQPAGAIAQGTALQPPAAREPIDVTPESGKPARKRRQSPRSNGASPAEQPLDWKHDSAKFGMPKQDWSTADKALWLLYVAAEVTPVKELSSRLIADTFNKHFRQAGQIRVPNVHRDLGLLKVKKTPAPLGEDTTASPTRWYLTDSGRQAAQALVAASLQ